MVGQLGGVLSVTVFLGILQLLVFPALSEIVIELALLSTFLV